MLEVQLLNSLLEPFVPLEKGSLAALSLLVQSTIVKRQDLLVVLVLELVSQQQHSEKFLLLLILWDVFEPHQFLFHRVSSSLI